MKRRTNTATWHKGLNCWRINVQKDGERKSFYSSKPGRTGQREANAKADAWLDDGISTGNERVKDAYEVFQAECKTTMSTTEYNHVDSVGRVWIVPNMGKKKLIDLCDGDIQRILDKAAAMGRSKKTIQDIKGITFRFIKWARRNKKTAYRPDDVHIPDSARLKGKKILQPSDLITFLTVDTTLYKGKVIKEPLIHAYRFQMITGLRPGELRGLGKADIKGNQVFIHRAINVFYEETTGKNENAVRAFVLPDLAVVELEAQLREYPNDTEFVFDLPSPTAYRERWQKYCATNGLTVTTPYELRHTFVSVAKSLPAGLIKPFVGHSEDMDTFGIYGHELTGEDLQTAQLINARFTEIITPKKDAEN